MHAVFTCMLAKETLMMKTINLNSEYDKQLRYLFQKVIQYNCCLKRNYNRGHSRATIIVQLTAGSTFNPR